MDINNNVYYLGRYNRNVIITEFSKGFGCCYLITAKAYHSDYPTIPVTLTWELLYKFNGNDEEEIFHAIKLIDLTGNKDSNKNCNKGTGSSLVLTTLALIKKFIKDNRGNEIIIRGALSNAGDTNVIESHKRRVHFWQKHGFTIHSPSCHFSKVSGKFESTIITTNLNGFQKIDSDLTGSNYNELINLLVWNREDDSALNQLVHLIPQRAIDLYKQIDIIDQKIKIKFDKFNKKSNTIKLIEVLYQRIFPPKACELSSKLHEIHTEKYQLLKHVELLMYQLDSNNFNLLFRAVKEGKILVPEPLLCSGKLSKYWLSNDGSTEFIRYLFIYCQSRDK